ncbi:hypothetical protein L0244_10485 [bacterium]|nr:hypothetical protein [bacterium]
MDSIYVAPPGLRMTDEIYRGIFFKNLVKTFKTRVVFTMLEMEQDRYPMIPRNLSDKLNIFRIALDLKFLLANADSSQLQISLDHLPRFHDIRKLVCKENEFIWKFLRQSNHRVVAQSIGFKAEF